MKLATSLTFFLLIATAWQTAFASGVRGRIIDTDGDPVPFATIFVQENGTGATANIEGEYELRLEPGDYTLVFQHLGYKAEVRKISVGQLFRTLDISLTEQPLVLNTVEVYEGREDPAYTVMRKAIAKASYHRQQLDSYRAQVYIKGSGRLKKSPFFLKKAMEKEGIDSSFAFVSESVSRIEYQRPNTFKETVISVYTQGDDNNTSPMNFVNGSFYEPEIGQAISPLSTKAFGYYKFELEGYFTDRGYGVNKIKVIPRSRGDNVFEGSIYIVEDIWSIHSLSLKTYLYGIGFLINQIYAPIEDKVWLPVTHKFNVDGKVLGFAFEYDYLATVSDYQITLNPDLDVDFAVIDEKIQKELAAEIKKQSEEKPKTADAKEKLASGEELTRKDLRKILREYEKEEQKAQEEPEVQTITTYTVDSLAYKRDSSYWAEIRPVPLTKYEVRGYEREDSLARVASMEKTEVDSAQTIRRKNKKGIFSISDIALGSTYPLGEKKQLVYESPLLHLFFNPVEGYNLGTNLSYVVNRENRFSFTVSPRYAFAREKLSAKAGLSYRFGNKLNRGAFNLEGGRYIFQYNPDNPISQIINTYTTLVLERNYISLYEKDYGRASFSKRFGDNYALNLSGEWAKRYSLENNTTQTWFNRDDRSYGPNIPENLEAAYPFPETEKALLFSIGLEAKPWQKYKIRNGVKQVIENSSPRLLLTYRKGLPGIADSDVNYDLLDFTYQHKFKPGARGVIDFKVNTGIFLNNESLGFADFKHFAGNRIGLTTSDPVGSFRLLDYYRHSTTDKYASVHAHYQFRKLLLTQIPEVWLLGIKENVFVNYLATPTSQNYVEVGYSLDNIFRVLRIEAAVAFQDGKYQDFGILIGIASNLGFVSFE